GALALLLGVLALTGAVVVWQVYVLAFALGMVAVVDSPTRQTFVAEMVGRDGMANAIALNSAAFNLARITGPAVAGLIISAVGTPVAFLVNAASFGAVLVGLKLMRPADLYPVERAPRARGQLREALAYVRARPNLWLTLALMFFVATFGMNFQVTTALISRGVFHAGAAAFGLASAAYAVGALGGALLAARRARPGMRLMLTTALAFGVLEVAAGLLLARARDVPARSSLRLAPPAAAAGRAAPATAPSSAAPATATGPAAAAPAPAAEPQTAGPRPG